MVALTDFLAGYTPAQYNAPSTSFIQPTDYSTKLMSWEEMQKKPTPTPTPTPAPQPAGLTDILKMRDLADENPNMFSSGGMFGSQRANDGMSYRAGQAGDSFYNLAQQKYGMNKDQVTQALGGYSPLIQGSNELERQQNELWRRSTGYVPAGSRND